MSSKNLWRTCLLAASILSVAAFTPLVIPAGKVDPMLAGIPVTLWAGGVIAFALVALTYLAGRVHPRAEVHADDGAGSRAKPGMTFERGITLDDEEASE